MFKKYLLNSLIIVTPLYCIAETELGILISDFTYEETANGEFLMDDKATMLGIHAAISSDANKADEAYWKLNSTLQFGDMDYRSAGTGTMSGHDDTIFELRGVIGKRSISLNNIPITPYIGLGYHYLIDDSEGMQTTTGHYGYLREQTYLYTPVGIEFSDIQIFGSAWQFGVNFEYDFLWYGENTTDLTSVDGPVLNFEQEDGYGLRTSARFYTQNFVIEPFIKYWNIDDSEIVEFESGGEIFGFYEPENTTLEYGVKLAYKF